jgi:hypothetical protein
VVTLAVTQLVYHLPSMDVTTHSGPVFGQSAVSGYGHGLGRDAFELELPSFCFLLYTRDKQGGIEYLYTWHEKTI